MKELLFALRSGFGWLSTIPVGISMEGIEALMRHVYVFPLVGLALGAILGGVAYAAGQALPANLVAIVVIVAIYKLCGINHIDGLADFGDGVIAHGTREKKVAAMKDVSLGTGGAVFMAIILLSAFATVSDTPRPLLPWALLVAEVSAKEAMICFAAFSTSLQKGFGQIMIERTGSAAVSPGAGHIRGLVRGGVGSSGPGGSGRGSGGCLLHGSGGKEELWRSHRGRDWCYQ